MEILIPIEIFFSSIIEILVIKNSLSSQILISFSFFNRYDRTGRNNNKKKKTGSGFPHTDVALSINGIVVGCRRNVTFFKNSQSRNASRRLTRSRRRRRNVFRHPDGSMSPLFPDQGKSELTVVIRFSCNCISFSSPSSLFFEAKDPSCQGTRFYE